ncbi:NUDIX hydrolase [Ensifer sp. ENS02]|uniref:NUDIX hydrolase n=1 Tax=Ensifer sp. ENS02 TaxID=2769290 RepID=UPI00177B1AD1|nr:NUDIX hydrolase [Ensifer sp. ENS02]MBD9525103.1 NUDIX hydrolase [Ensifer sp. ENS02]
MPAESARRSALSVLTHVVPQLLNGDVIRQFAAICVRRKPDPDGSVEILLITSRGSRRWIIPKGWAMKSKKPHQVAKQEAWEEAGVRGRAWKRPCGYYTYAKALADGALMPALVQVHLLEVAELASEFPEKGQRRLQWFGPHEAATMVDEPELKRLLAMVPVMIGTA